MAMSKRRSSIWEKSGGRCWYCGAHLQEKGWHEDHLDPVLRMSVYSGNGKFEPTGEMQKPSNDCEDNKVPSCAPCNLFKSTLSVEEFRVELQKQIERARRSSVNFRTAERFGLISVEEKPVVFWFETLAANGG